MVRLREDRLNALVHLLDDREEIGARTPQVVHLLREEAKALLQCGELLQCQWVDLAQQCETALRRLEPSLLLRAVIGVGLRRGGVGIDLVAGGRGRRRHQLIGAVLRHEGIRLDAELLDDAPLHLLDAQALLRARDLVAMHRVGQPLHLRAKLAK